LRNGSNIKKYRIRWFYSYDLADAIKEYFGKIGLLVYDAVMIAIHFLINLDHFIRIDILNRNHVIYLDEVNKLYWIGERKDGS